MKIGEERMRFLNEREVSLLTGIALSTLRNNRHVGKGIPYSKISKSVRYALKDILDYMQAHRIDTSAIYRASHLKIRPKTPRKALLLKRLNGE